MGDERARPLGEHFYLFPLWEKVASAKGAPGEEARL